MMYGLIYNKLIYPAYHALQRDGANRVIREMTARDSLAADELVDVERRKLAELLCFAAENVPYYSTFLRDIGASGIGGDPLGALAELPLLDKEIIRARTEDLIASDLSDNRIDANSTSGSSGSPLHFYTDIRSRVQRKGSVVRNREWIGIHRGDPVVHLWGSPIDARRAAAIRGKIHSMVTRELFLSAYHMQASDMRAYARRMKSFRPRLLIGYPSILVEFGRFCAREDIRIPGLRAIITSAETLYPHQREEIATTLNAPVFNRYGCREVGDIAHEKPGVEGLVVNSDRIFVEILNADGDACAPGQTGEIVVTDLDNFGMPLIRYRIGDMGAWSDSCGREGDLPYPVLKEVSGRTLDVVRAPNGNRVGGTFWTILFRQRPGIGTFKVVQGRLDAIEVQFVRSAGSEEIDTAYFRDKIADVCGSELGVSFREVSEIPADPNGKFRIIESSLTDQERISDD